jgi:predicted acyl esterase
MTGEGRRSHCRHRAPWRAARRIAELKETVERSVAGKDPPLEHFVFEMRDRGPRCADAREAFTAEVPEQRAAYVRDGYESLRKATETDPLISKPTFDIVTEQVMAPARDGVRLATAVWRPKGEGRFPVVLIRTPYKKEMLELNAKFYARRGYAVAVQDCRGRFGSEGTWEPFVHKRGPSTPSSGRRRSRGRTAKSG